MSDGVKELKGYAAALIRKHMWLGESPPESPDSRPWTMARELSIWQRLVETGYPPEDINGAISVVRRLSRNPKPFRMTVFYWKNGDGFTSTPFLERSIALYHKGEGREDRRTYEGLRKAEFNEWLASNPYTRGRFSDYATPGSDTVTGSQREGRSGDSEPKPGSAGEQPGRSEESRP